MLIDIHFGKDKSYTLTYKIYDTEHGRLFYDRMKSQPNNLISRKEFYGFGETEQDILSELENIKSFVAERLPDKKLGDDLNVLHSEFVELHNYAEQNDPELYEVLRDFNYRIHHLEFLQNKLESSAIFFMSDGDAGVSLPESALQDFTISREPGKLYMSYPHVGKSFYSVFLDNDLDITPEQIECTTLMRNTLFMWFGKGVYDTDSKHNAQMRRIMNFYLKVQEKMPYDFDDKRLTIGNLLLGDAIDMPDNIVEILEKHKYLHSWKCK